MAGKRKPSAQLPEPSSSEEEEVGEVEEEEDDDDVMVVEVEESDETEEEEEDDEEDEEEDDDEHENDKSEAREAAEEWKVKPEEVKEEEKEEEDEDDEDEDEDDDDDEEDDIDPSDRESIRQILEPFGKDQLIDLLKEAALRNPALLDRIAASADSDPVHRKIFVHGLGWDTTTESLASFFSAYGAIEECKAVADRTTGRCKGYGFILFRTRAAAQRALLEPQKKIGNRMTSCQLASFGPPGAAPEAPTGRKIYVSNIGDHVNPERLRAFFASFGEIEEGPLGYDKTTGKLRGFAIFVYKMIEGCNKALEEPKKYFEGCELSCQRAVEGLKPKSQAIGVSNLPLLQPNDLALYASQSVAGLNPVAGLVGQSLSPTVGLLGQNAGVLNQGSVAAGLSPPYGVGLGLGGGGLGVNSISPSVIGSYQSQLALQGLGAYTNSYLPSSTGSKSQSGHGSLGSGLPQYLGR